MNRKHPQQGFSLLELTLVLVILGTLSMSLWKLMPRILAHPAVQALLSTELERSENALLGHIYIHSRLPCPASEPGGAEDCSRSTGWLPERTLGVALDRPLYYRVSGGAGSTPSLIQTQDLYRPELLELTPPAINNGLDFCRALDQIHLAGNTAPLTTSDNQRPVAYALIDAGRDADGDGNSLDGENLQEDRVIPANTPQTLENDDAQRVTGPLELYGRLQCHDYLGRVQASVVAANAAYDTDRLAEAYVDFRTFAYRVRVFNVDVAQTGVYIAAAELAIAVASEASAIAVAVISNGVVGTDTVVTAAISVTLAISAMEAAVSDLVEAEEEEPVALSQLYAAEEYKSYTAALRTQARDTVLAYYQKGIKP